MKVISRSNRSLWVALATSLFVLACLAPRVADAKKRRHRQKNAPAKVAKVNVVALGQLMGPFSFGMSKEKIIKLLDSQLSVRTTQKVRSTSDVYEQDKWRREQNSAVKKIRNSFIAFNGKKSGWDVSIIDDQFAHHTDESMLVYWEHNPDGRDQRRFFFFHDGDLYKMFITLDSAMLPQAQRSFEFFKSLMVKRYGQGKIVTETRHDGATYPVLVDWNSSKYHVQALDKLHFYGSFCLSIADPAVESSVMEAREAHKTVKKGNAIINSMVQGQDDALPSLDSNTSGVDAIIGK